MADDRHAPDTLFFVAEEDFRLFARHSAAQPEALSRLAEAAYAASSTAWAARSTFTEGVNEPVALTLDELYAWRYRMTPVGTEGDEMFGPPAAGTDSWKKLIGGLYAPVHKPSAAEVSHTGVSEYMEDLVKMVTAAHREGLGDLVWLSYDAFDRRGSKCRVCHASTLVAVTAAGARKLAEIVPDADVFGKDGHFDVLLLKYLAKHGNEFGASYVYPCVGHYQAHLSQSSDTEGWRNSQWLKNWVQEGTKTSHTPGGRTRWILGWTEKDLAWKRSIMLPERDEDLRWFTRTSAPQGWIEEMDDRQRAHAERVKGKGKGKAPPVVLQPFYTAAPTDMAGTPAAETSRRKRQRRANQVGYSFRIFASPGQRVVVVCEEKSHEPVAWHSKKISSYYDAYNY